MAQDSTPAIIMYRGDGSNNVFSVPFDKGQYGEIKVAYVRRGLTDYIYNPDTYTLGITLYAWTATEMGGTITVYTNTPIPYVPDEDEEEEIDPSEYTKIYDAYGNETTSVVTAYEGNAIQIDYDEVTTYTRDESSDIVQHQYLVWNGDTLTSDDWICIVRETENSQPFVYPANQKHIEGALDNLERQIQELKGQSSHVLIVDPTPGSMSPIEWLETIVRCTDLSARELRYYNGWLQYSLDDPKSAAEDKTWYNLLNTTNIRSLYYKYTEDDEGRPLYNVYYKDNNGEEHLLSYDADIQRLDIEELKNKVAENERNINGEKLVRREADEELRQLINTATYDVTQFDGRITQNTNNITALDNRFDATVTSSDKAMPKSYIDGLVSGIYHIKGIKETVDELPTEGNVVGDCWNVLEDGKTYIWTEDEEWVSGAASVDLTPYRTSADQDVIDAGKQDKLTEGSYIEITNNNTINMTGKFGSSLAMNGKNLSLKDQDGQTLSEQVISVGVDAEYTAATEDIKFDEGESGDFSFIQEQIDAITVKIPDNASSSNKFATHDDIGTGTLTITRNNSNVGTFNANASTDNTINITVPVNAADVNALPDTTKYGASLSVSINSSTYVMTFQLKDQNNGNLGTAQTIDLPLESVVVSGSYNSAEKKIVLTLKDGSTIDIPVGDLISGLQTEITDSNKLSADLVDDTETTHKFVSATDKTNWNNKVDKTNTANKVYGTNSEGGQTTYDITSFGAVDDVQVNNVSVVSNKIANIDLTGKIDHCSTMPTASADNLGKIVQWIGADTADYTNGYFYKCVSDGENPATYSWTQCNVQPQGDSLPPQAGNNGKYLKTNGSVASWEEIPESETYIAGDNITIAGVLPDGYTLVEYVESDGIHYIDTGKKWKNSSTVVIKAKGIETTNVSRCIAGSVNSGLGFQIVTENNRIGWQIGGAGYSHTSTNVSDEVKVDIPNNSAYFNGTLISDSYTATVADQNVYLFANNYGGTAQSFAHVRLFRYMFYRYEGYPEMDLVPCKNSSNVYGLYDLVSDTFFTCEGLTGGEAGRIISAKVPEVGDGTIYIKQGNVNKGSFRTNQSSSTTITLDESQIIQVSSMPTANAGNLGKIVQWIGGGNTYTNGYFYKCVSDEQPTPTYSWDNVNVQPQGASSISSLTDVQLTSLSDGDTLVYDATNSKWKNGTGGVSATYDSTTKTITFA